MAVENPTQARAGAAPSMPFSPPMTTPHPGARRSRFERPVRCWIPRSPQRGAGTSCGPGMGYSASRRAPSDGGIAGIEGSRIRRPGAVE